MARRCATSPKRCTTRISRSKAWSRRRTGLDRPAREAHEDPQRRDARDDAVGWGVVQPVEALTAVNCALLTIYDMCKAVDRGMRMEGIQLMEKLGGKSGHWQAA